MCACELLGIKCSCKPDFALFAPHTDLAACSNGEFEFEFECSKDKKSCEKCAKLGL